MIINADFLLPHLREKMRLATRDGSRHVLCPRCRRRTKLYALRDRRRKCKSCGKKFRIDREAHKAKLRQYAILIVCFCLDCTAHKTAAITGYRYRLISAAFAQFRELLGAKKPPVIIRHTKPVQGNSALQDISPCAVCRRLAAKKAAVPLFGVRQAKDKVFLDPLLLQSPLFSARSSSPQKEGDLSASYGGFVCHGTFHRFPRAPGKRGGEFELFWAWAEERLRPYHGVSPRNIGAYLKEMEWKYNHRNLKPQMQSIRLMLLLPSDFLQAQQTDDAP